MTKLEGGKRPAGDGTEERASSQGAGDRSTAPPGLTQRALGGMLWTFSGTGVQALVQLLVLMALGRLLTPGDFGLMGAAAVVIALSQIVSQVGVGPAIVQRRELDRTHVRVAFTISGFLGLVLGVAVWLGAPALAAFYRIPAVEPVLRAVAFLFPIDGLNTVGESLLARFEPLELPPLARLVSHPERLEPDSRLGRTPGVRDLRPLFLEERDLSLYDRVGAPGLI